MRLASRTASVGADFRAVTTRVATLPAPPTTGSLQCPDSDWNPELHPVVVDTCHGTPKRESSVSPVFSGQVSMKRAGFLTARS